MWLNSVSGMLSSGSPLATEFRSGGVNIYPVYLVAEFVNSMTGSEVSDTQLLVVGRVILTVLLGSGAVVFIYETTRLMFGRTAIALVAGVAFLVSPFVYAVSRYWYPDHYIAVMSAGLLYFTVRATLGPPRFRNWGFAGLFLGLAVSTKYTGAFLSLPLLVAAVASVWGAKRPGNGPSSIRNMIPYWSWSVAVALAAVVLINASAFFELDRFRADWQYNLDNYARDGFNFAGIAFYLVLLYLLSMSLPGVIAYFLGYRTLYRESRTFFVLLSLFPVLIAIYMGSAPLVINRNMSIALPFILPVFALGLVSLTKLAPGWRRTVGWTMSVIILIVPSAQLAMSITKDLRSDSRFLAEAWLARNLPQAALVGTNEFCSGPSPAAAAGLFTENDHEMAQNLPYYVMNSYWLSPLSASYRTRGMLQQLDQKYLHYYNGFWDPAPFRISMRSPSVKELADARGYRVLKTFSSNGPEIVVLERK